MSKFAAVTIATLMLMAVFVSAASAATSVNTVEVRSPVFSGSSLSTITVDFDYTEFAGFYYEIDDDIGSESMSIDNTKVDDPRTITDGGLIYTTVIQQVGYEFDEWEANDQYPKMGFLAEEYVPVNDKPDVLSKLLLDSDDKYTLRVGQTLDLGEGYTLTPKQIDVEGDKVWLELSKDGEYLDDEVITVTDSDVDNSTWDYEEDDVGGEDDVVIMRVHVNEVFQGQVDSLAVIEGMWLISNEPMEIAGDDEFDELEVTNVGTNSLTLQNTDDITLSADDDLRLAGNMNIKVADSDDLRYYLYAEYTIGNVTEPTEPVTPGEETPVTPGEETPVTPGEETPVTPGEETPVEETPTNETETPDTPGFEAIFAVAGLLAVAYLVRRN